MSVAKISEITSTSKTSFDDAVADGIKRAHKTIRASAERGWPIRRSPVKSGKKKGSLSTRFGSGSRSVVDETN